MSFKSSFSKDHASLKEELEALSLNFQAEFYFIHLLQNLKDSEYDSTIKTIQLQFVDLSKDLENLNGDLESEVSKRRDANREYEQLFELHRKLFNQQDERMTYFGELHINHQNNLDYLNEMVESNTALLEEHGVELKRIHKLMEDKGKEIARLNSIIDNHNQSIYEMDDRFAKHLE